MTLKDTETIICLPRLEGDRRGSRSHNLCSGSVLGHQNWAVPLLPSPAWVLALSSSELQFALEECRGHRLSWLLLNATSSACRPCPAADFRHAACRAAWPLDGVCGCHPDLAGQSIRAVGDRRSRRPSAARSTPQPWGFPGQLLPPLPASVHSSTTRRRSSAVPLTHFLTRTLGRDRSCSPAGQRDARLSSQSSGRGAQLRVPQPWSRRLLLHRSSNQIFTSFPYARPLKSRSLAHTPTV